MLETRNIFDLIVFVPPWFHTYHQVSSVSFVNRFDLINLHNKFYELFLLFNQKE